MDEDQLVNWSICNDFCPNEIFYTTLILTTDLIWALNLNSALDWWFVMGAVDFSLG